LQISLCFKYASSAYAGETRFATSFIMLQRMEVVKQSLQQTVVADQWNDWLRDNNSALNDEADDIRSTVSS
jgi:hypothetical protein